ncbi:cytidylyltransferase domain-containing protein [Phenylobacterium montanum]|uniref:Glycosyltransferase family protein n=1 Tax=Phenylobacterium montanum TaxID=2823693 RepID=A0A975G2Z4_9CAUL|nr:glycosyltransferase family protein [Caulobacter sp. S6]QUD89935.1 glycosyltransferase family protein [Caulobacter sp. S6]
MRIAVIIQARMGSTRLPGKVLMDLGGRTVLARVLERAKAIPGADVVVCAIPEGPDDDPVAEEAARAGAVVTRGSRDDVLDRYWRAAQAVKADAVMRVTSDCPLIDPKVCGDLIALFQRSGADYACINDPASWPHGLECEIFSFAWLDKAAREAKKPSEREHVSPFIRTHPDARRVNMLGPGPETVRHRWTLDHADDLTFLRALWARLPEGRAAWDWHVAFAIVEADPALAAINAGHDRLEGLNKSLAQDAREGFAR